MLDEYLHSADWFDAMLFDATDAILKGYSCMEIEHGCSVKCTSSAPFAGVTAAISALTRMI